MRRLIQRASIWIVVVVVAGICWLIKPTSRNEFEVPGIPSKMSGPSLRDAVESLSRARGVIPDAFED